MIEHRDVIRDVGLPAVLARDGCDRFTGIALIHHDHAVIRRPFLDRVDRHRRPVPDRNGRAQAGGRVGEDRKTLAVHFVVDRRVAVLDGRHCYPLFQPSQSTTAPPITRSRSRPLSHGISSVNIVTHWRYEIGMRVMSVPQKQRSGPKVSMMRWRYLWMFLYGYACDDVLGAPESFTPTFGSFASASISS